MAAVDRGIDAFIGRVLKGEYKKRGQRLQDLAAATGIPTVTLQRKISGKTSFLASELIAICLAMDPTLDAGDVLDEAIRFYSSMSEATPTTDDITKKRNEKKAQARTAMPEELEQLPGAATDDPELEQDEPPTT